MQEETLEQQQEERLAKLQHWQALKTAAGTFATEEVLNLLAHAIMGNPSGMIEGALFGGIAAIAAGYQAPKVLRSLRESLPHTEELEPFWLLTHREPGKRSLMDKLLDRQPPDEYHAQAAVVESVQRAEEWEEAWYDEDEDEEEDVVLPSTAGSRFTFSQVLSSGFTPSLHRIYLGRLTDGSPVYVEAKDLCHVALAGNTGGGKSSLMRLIMVQLCSVGVRVLLLNPHYMRYDRAANEDWTPFDPYLNKPAIDCARYVNIKLYLQWMVETLLPRRIARARDGQPIGKPFFAVIDELPAIVAEIKEAPGYIAKLLREGRKYGIFLVVASQDFLVKTTGMDGGGVRKCFRTALYVGGDPTTANVLLNETQGKIPENELGKGTIMLRCAATRQPVLASVPYVDNASLYTLLGPSTFVAGASDEEEEVVTSYVGSLSSELPGNSRKPTLSVVPPLPGASQELPQDGMNEPGELVECTSEDFQPRGDDLQLTEFQAELLVVYYRHCSNINKSLEQIKNDKGQGLGGRYFRHASYLLEQRGLKKRKA